MWSIASAGERIRTAAVMRVSRVANANTSAWWRIASGRVRWRYARAYGSIDPLTSSSTTTLRGCGRGLARTRVTVSPPVRLAQPLDSDRPDELGEDRQGDLLGRSGADVDADR